MYVPFMETKFFTSISPVFHLYGILVANVEKVQKVHDEINDLLKQYTKCLHRDGK